MTTLGCRIRRDYAERIKAAAAAAGTTPSTIMRKALDDFMRETETE
jgi:predicted transcriptional regulator